MNTVMMNVKQPRKITGRMVLVGFIAFFGLIAVVNGVFMYFALSTWPGLTTEDAYKKGIAFNQILDAAAEQQSLGWRSTLTIDTDGRLRVLLLGNDGAPVIGAIVEVAMSRPLGNEAVRVLKLGETAPGVYAAAFAAPMAGRWKADITAVRAEGNYRMRHEVMVRK